MATRFAEWHPFNDQFAAHSGTNRVELFDVSRKPKGVAGSASNDLALSQYRDVSTPVSCFNWWAPYNSPSTKLSLLAVGTNAGVVSLVDWSQPKDTVIYDSASARRPCTGVAWNRYHESKLAAGFEKPRSQGEFCAIVWDIEAGASVSNEIVPRTFFKPSSEEPTASICWLPHEPNLLAVGTSISWVRIYDTRMGGAECLAIMAHTATRPRKVRGIRPDPLQQHIIATFSDSAGEPIKIWDLRKSGPAAKPKLTIVQPAVSAVLDAAWSSARTGVLAVATSQQRSVSFYSTIKPPVETISRSPIHSIAVPDIPRSISWQGQTARTPVFSINPSTTTASAMTGVDNIQTTSTSTAPTAAGASSSSSSLTTPMPTDAATPSIFTSEGYFALLLSSSSSSGTAAATATTATATGPTNRMLVASLSGFADLDVIESVGLALGAEGLVAVGSSNTVLLYSGAASATSTSSTSSAATSSGATGVAVTVGASGGLTPTAVAGSGDREAISSLSLAFGRSARSATAAADIETLMKLRSNAGYSMDALKNLQVLSDEVDALYAAAAAATSASEQQNEQKQEVLSSTDAPSSSSSSSTSVSGSGSGSGSALDQAQSLYRLWAWVDRVESLHGESSVTLSSCGVISLLSLNQPSEQPAAAIASGVSGGSFTGNGTAAARGAAKKSSSEFLVHPQLGIAAYTSIQRRLAREICGWTDIHGLPIIPSYTDGGGGGSQRSDTETESSGGLFKGIPAIRGGVSGSSSLGKTTTVAGAAVGAGNTSRRESLVTVGGNGGTSSRNGGGGVGLGGNRDRNSVGFGLSEYDLGAEDETSSSPSVGSGTMVVSSELDDLIEECEDTDSFERAVALAIWHGNLDLAVKVLQRTISSLRGDILLEDDGLTASHHTISQHSARQPPPGAGAVHQSSSAYSESVRSESRAAPVTAENEAAASLLSLVAMCLAGYHNDNAATGSGNGALAAGTLTGRTTGSVRAGPQQTMWASMCRHVLSQIESEHSRPAYLTAGLRFLLDTLDPQVLATANGRGERGGGERGGEKKQRGGGGTSSSSSTSTPKFSSVILDERLSLEDRVGFACSYLDDLRAIEWLRKVKDSCTEIGDLGGLTLTGLSKEGLSLLQHYLDRTDDIQTVALLAGRNVIDAGAAAGGSSGGGGSQVSVAAEGGGTVAAAAGGKGREWQWLFEYRNLLNQWALFIDRAALDVELGRRYRMAKPTKLFESTATAAGSEKSLGAAAGGPGGGGAAGRIPGRGAGAAGGVGGSSAGRGGGIDRKTNAARVLYQLPPHSDLPHVFLRCNYCSSSLPVDPMQQTQAAAFLRKQRPIINCCPSCKKPLPRCYVCLLYMGLVNPHAEFNRVLAQRNAAAATTAGASGAAVTAGGGDAGWGASHNEEAHNMLDFGRWFFFCQHCKHGGHAACIDDWFGGREVCGVNGCYCCCRALK